MNSIDVSGVKQFMDNIYITFSLPTNGPGRWDKLFGTLALVFVTK